MSAISILTTKIPVELNEPITVIEGMISPEWLRSDDHIAINAGLMLIGSCESGNPNVRLGKLVSDQQVRGDGWIALPESPQFSGTVNERLHEAGFSLPSEGAELLSRTSTRSSLIGSTIRLQRAFKEFKKRGRA